MIILAAALTAAINIEIDVARLLRPARQAEAKVTCGINTVGYRFRGTPGQKFQYAGDTYEIPTDGWVELIAHPRRSTYAIAGRSLPLDVWPRDQFGFREVPMPAPNAAPAN